MSVLASAPVRVRRRSGLHQWDLGSALDNLQTGGITIVMVDPDGIEEVMERHLRGGPQPQTEHYPDAIAAMSAGWRFEA